MLSKEDLEKKNSYYNKGDVSSYDVVYQSELDANYAMSREEYRDVTFIVNWGAWKKGETYKVALGLSEALIDNNRAKLTYPERYETHMTAEQIEAASIETEKAFHLQCQVLRAAADKKLKNMEK